MCKRNIHDKNEHSMGCVRETLPIKIKKKPPRDLSEKVP